MHGDAVRLINTNPLGAVDFPLLNRRLDAGEEFEVADELGAELLTQIGNYELASDAPVEAPTNDAQEG